MDTVKKPVNKFISLALAFGIASLLLAFTCTVYPTLCLGGLSIIFAILSKGSDEKMDANAKTGVITAVVGLSFSVALVACSAFLIFSPQANPIYRQEFNKMYEQIYGESFEDTLHEAMGQ